VVGLDNLMFRYQPMEIGMAHIRLGKPHENREKFGKPNLFGVIKNVKQFIDD
tara:strand:+ start:440 stop:595 length:156 start_codon:yes stop_codon:yes gene_type:complete